jgi:hypothetical protein
MAKEITGPLVELLRRDHVHGQDIAAALDFLRRRLAEEGIPFAVIGAMALRQYGLVRATEDIDILTTPDGLDRIHATLVGRGLAPRGPGLRKGLRETAHEVSIDVVTSGEHAGSSESPVVYPPPDTDAFVDIGGVRFPTLETLVEFKIASGVWGHRHQDLGDVQNLIRIHGLSETSANRLSVTVREHFLRLLRETRQQRQPE